MTPELELMRADNAKRLLNDELFIEAVTMIREEIAQQWGNSPARDTEGRERLFLSRKMLDKITGHLESVMESGKLARATLAQRAKAALRGQKADF